MELDELFKFFKSYRSRRIQENLSAGQLFKKELQLLGAAIVTIIILIGAVGGIAWILMR